ncbi:MAG: hypothetical protein K0S41_2741, partial [Anaerocolumna sp.]|nr:hypothetical protein [Anaerocolumna sp.]
MKKTVGTTIKRSRGTVIFDTINTIFMIIICFLCLYPIW